MTSAQDLTKRLDSLEHEQRCSRKWKWLSVLTLFLLLLFLVFWAHSRENAGLLLVDEKGKPRLKIDFDDQGGPYLALLDSEGMVRCQLGLSDEGNPSLSLRRRDGSEVLRVALDEDEVPNLSFVGEGQNPRVSITSKPPALILTEDSGEPRVVLGVSSKGSAAFSLIDDQGNPMPLR